MTEPGYDLLGLTRRAALSAIGVSTWSNMSTSEGLRYRRVDPHSASSALQSIPKPLRLRDSATLWEPCCNHSLPPLPPSFTESQMDGAEKPGERRACWVASSQTVDNHDQGLLQRLLLNQRSRKMNQFSWQDDLSLEKVIRLHAQKEKHFGVYCYRKKTIKWTYS